MSDRERIFRVVTITTLLEGILILGLCLFTFFLFNTTDQTSDIFIFFLNLQALSALTTFFSIFTLFRLKHFISKEEMEFETNQLQLQQAQEMIKSLNIQRHDFKNQMSLITAWAELGKTQEILDYLRDESLNILEAEAFSHIKCPVLQALFLVVDAKCREENIRFQIDTATSLEDFQFPWTKIHKIFSNLLTNAIEAVNSQVKSDSDREIQLIIWDTQDSYHFIIWTPTVLPDPNNPEKVFSLGYSTKEEQGHGMGLHIVRSIVKELGGAVWAENEMDNGTEFHVQLPFKARKDMESR